MINIKFNTKNACSSTTFNLCGDKLFTGRNKEFDPLTQMTRLRRESFVSTLLIILVAISKHDQYNKVYLSI